VDAVEHLVGMQAQAPWPPYFGLWTRLEAFQPTELADALLDRRVVRIALMRNTVHLVSAEDCVTLRPVVQRAMESQLRGGTVHARALAGLDLQGLARHGRSLVEARPRPSAELRSLLAERYPDRAPESLLIGVRNLVPLVQLPPRAIWGRGGQTVYSTAESWLGRPLAATAGVDDMVLRYLGAFGPATVRDLQTWCGLTRLAEVVERLRPGLVAFTGEHGEELFDLPAAPRPNPDAPAPVRFLAEFDNLLLSHAERSRIIDPKYRQHLASRNGMVPGTVLIDGFVQALWRIERERDGVTLVVSPFSRLTDADAEDVEQEGRRLLAFAAKETGAHEVQVEAELS
jgi:hypothetical protein